MRKHAVIALLLVAVAGCSPGEPTTPAIDVDAPTALIDQPVRVRVTGLPVGAQVLVEATADDESAARWRSHATFSADEDGVVDLAEDAPAEGTYSGADAMGLFWSMVPPTGDPDRSHFVPPFSGEVTTFGIRLAVRSGDREIAARDLTRQVMGDGVTLRPLTMAGEDLVGYLFLPAAGSPRRPGVLAFTGSDGGTPIADAAMLASHGHPALALAYFSQPGLPTSLRDVPLEYFVRAARLLRTQPGADPASVVVTGYSRGSEAALLLAQHHPDLVWGAILCAPNDEVGPSFPDHTGYAWSLGGKPVPEQDIPVDRITGSVLAIAGDADALWPAAAQARRIMANLDRAKVSAAHQALIYPGAGHGVGTVPYLPAGIATVYPTTKTEMFGGGTRQANAAAKADGWPKVLSFLEAVRR